MNKPELTLIGVVSVVVVVLLVSLLTASHPKDDLTGRLTPVGSVQEGASPNGKWVLHATGGGDNSPHFPVAQEKNGAHTITWPYRYYNGDGCWLADSRQWASQEVTNAGRTLLIFHLNSPKITRIPLSLPPEAEDLLGFTPQGHALFANARPEVRSRIGLDTFIVADADITTNPPTMRTFSIKKPNQKNGDWGQVSLSPQGDRLAWIYSSSQPSSIGSWISFWRKNSYGGGRETLDIWVSRLDDNTPRYVGELNGRQLSFAPAVHWMPDGKSLSLTVNGASYAVPID